MLTFLKRLPQSTFIGLSGLIIAALLAASFALIVAPRLMPHIAHATTVVTCAQERTAERCDKQDPEIQGCAADAQTNAAANIGEIGLVERRFSPTCRTWWGRVFDFRTGVKGGMIIGVAGIERAGPPDFVGNLYRIRYSLTVFDPQLTLTVPEVTGTLIDGTTQVSATIPAIPIPNP